ncbi:metallophosphoesterase [Phreatobacter sp.]|uniref:metallophosphoesterase family protein n=1 Tax=Phreatobacter sp. TaxID=1966341 RepID=UPI0026345355|nr:metallophosphoesterase [Phreatobacter sp.]
MRGSGVTTIAHVSDLHLAPVPFPFGEGLKPALGWINWRRKPDAHDPAIAARVAEAVRAAAPDQVAMTGDLIELGQASEYGAAAEALAAFGPPCRLSWAPGNHDVYTVRAVPRLREALGGWLAPETGPQNAADIRGHFPRLVVVGRVALVTLCSGLPTWLFSAEGEIGAAQLARFDAALSSLDRTAHLPVIAIHHPPHAPGLSPLKRLRDGDVMMRLLARHRCPLVLHGHLHTAGETTATVDGFAITLAGAPSASSAGHHGDDPAGYSLVHVDEALGWRLERRAV